MVELKTAEHVVHFMMKDINLSRFDKRFVESLQVLNQITTNQVELFYKIVFKYRRQFLKHELDVDKLIYLPWNKKVIESSIQYTAGHVSIENDKIFFKCPYNKNFIQAFRNQPSNTFVWDKESRQYESNYGAYQLRLLATIIPKFFKEIHYCNVTQSILEKVKEYETVKYWQPTLLTVNGNLMIVATNGYLDEALGDMVLNTDSKTIATLVYHGVTIDPSVYDATDNKQVFMANMFVDVELDSTSNIVPWLKEINCDAVFLFKFGHMYIECVKNILDKLVKAKIDVILEDTIIKRKYNFPVILRFKTIRDTIEISKVGKNIKIVDSTPVEVK
jgi:hypothetical protein